MGNYVRFLLPIYAVIKRDLIKLTRQKGRLLSAIIRPLIWLLVIGSGFNAMIDREDENYFDFIVPGVVGMSILFGALLGSLSMVYEKETGVMRMILVSPLTHKRIIFAKMCAASLSAVVQVFMLLVVLFTFGFVDFSINFSILFVGIVILAIACSALGMLVASFSETLDNFAAIMNFVIFPVFFLSGSLYPIQSLPPLLRNIAEVNPYTYGVDILKHAILVPNGMAADFPLLNSVGFLLIFTVTAFFISSWRFSQEKVSANWFPRKKRK